MNNIGPEVYTEYKRINKELTSILFTEENFTTELIGEECPICYDELDTSNSVISDCNHRYCMSCVLGTIWMSMKRNAFLNPTCPLCREVLHINPVHPLCSKNTNKIE